MKKLFFLLAAVAMLVSCKDKNEADDHSLTGTYWAYESSTSTSTKTYYCYYVWHFTSETTATSTYYDTGTTRVDIYSGEDPAKVGKTSSTADKVVVHFTCSYPTISNCYETVTYYYSGATENTNYCSGSFSSSDHFVLTFPKTGLKQYHSRIKK